MGSITISVTTGSTTREKTFTISDANIGRLAAWAKVSLSRPGDDPATPITNAQALERWAEWVMELSRGQVVSDERQRTAVPDFGVTPA